MTDIDALLEGPEPDYDDAPPPAEDLAKAEWHRAKIRRITAEQIQTEELYRDTLAEINRRKKSALSSIGHRLEWHTTAIAAWHQKEHRAGRLTETVQLPSGNSELRDNPVIPEVTNEDELRAFLEEVGDINLIYPPVEPTLSKTALNAYINRDRPKPEPEPGAIINAVSKDDGAIVPGVQIRWPGKRWQKGGKV